jgi:hypothetical protein
LSLKGNSGQKTIVVDIWSGFGGQKVSDVRDAQTHKPGFFPAKFGGVAAAVP